MSLLLRSIVYVLLFVIPVGVFFAGATEGKGHFGKICIACHTIGHGRLVGPDLKNVYLRRDEDWLIKFIQSSQTVIKSGDAYAVALFNEFNQRPMPDNPFTASEIRDIICYIKSESTPKAPVVAKKTVNKKEKKKMTATKY